MRMEGERGGRVAFFRGCHVAQPNFWRGCGDPSS